MYSATTAFETVAPWIPITDLEEGVEAWCRIDNDRVLNCCRVIRRFVAGVTESSLFGGWLFVGRWRMLSMIHRDARQRQVGGAVVDLILRMVGPSCVIVVFVMSEREFFIDNV